MAGSDRRQDPSELSIKDAREQWLAKQTGKTDRTQSAYDRRTRLFIQWCENEEITTVGELSPFLIDQFDLWIRNRYDSDSTIRGRLQTNKQLLDYIDGLGIHDAPLADAIDVPVLDRQQASNQTRLRTDDATALLAHYRDDLATFGSPEHAFLELAWFTGARVGSLRALDLGDYEPDEHRIRFQHRPDSGTGLKNKQAGERYVGLSDDVCDALDAYIARERSDKWDDHGRRPLFCSRQGRVSFTTLRAWSYLGTQPCVYGPCPHERDPATCEYRERNHSSKCPSSRSPHQIRTGSITWQLDQGLPPETVAARVNATPRVIREFYDVAEDDEAFQERRSHVADQLDDHDDEDSP